VWKGGLASHGAIFGITAALWWYCRSRPTQPLLWLIDRIIITVALAGFFIRIGNFFNSEIVGKPTQVAHAIIFDRLQDNTPRHPTQLYEAIFYLLSFGILWYLYKKTNIRKYTGRLLGLFFVLIFGFRFFVEFFKDIQVDFENNLPLNMGQMLSIPVVLAGLYFIFSAKKQVENT
jgi:prolipoprotein diacylglyceryl transferase